MPCSAGTYGEQEDSEHTQQEPSSREQLSSHPGGGQGQVLHKDRAGIQGKETFCCLDKLPGSAVGQLLWGSLIYRPGEAAVWQPSWNVPSENFPYIFLAFVSINSPHTYSSSTFPQEANKETGFFSTAFSKSQIFPIPICGGGRHHKIKHLNSTS